MPNPHPRPQFKTSVPTTVEKLDSITRDEYERLRQQVETQRVTIARMGKTQIELEDALRDVCMILHDSNELSDNEVRYKAFELAAKTLRPLGFRIALHSEAGHA